MFLLFLLSMLISLAATLPLPTSPLTLGLWVLLLSISSTITLTVTISSWLGIITILIYIGGLNVLFAYFITTVPNQHLFFKPLIFSLLLTFFILIINIIIFLPSFFWSQQTIYSITKLLFNFDNVIFLFLAGILFLALVTVVKIARRHRGPLRPFII